MSSIANNVVFVLFVTSIAGSLLTGFWRLTRKLLEKHTDVRDMYRLLRVIALVQICPFFYLMGKYIVRARQEKMTVIDNMSSLMDIICFVLFLVWLVGIFVLTLIRIISWRYFRSIIRGCIRSDVKSKRILGQACEDLKMRKKVRLYRGYTVASPFVRGIFWPAIYLPMDDLREERELEMVFHHELSHLKQKDTLWKPIFAMINYVYWFSPLSGYLWRQLTLWAEVCCDANCYEGNFKRKEYFELLLRVQDSYMNRAMDFMPMWSEGKNQLLWRLNHMNTGKVNRISRIAVAVIAAICLLFGSSMTSAASSGMQQLYEKVYWKTTNNMIMENEMETEDGQIHYGTMAELEADTTIVEPGEAGIMPLDGSTAINWTTLKHTTDVTRGFSVDKGKPITVMLKISKKSDKIRVGIMEPGDLNQYIVGGGDVYKTFTTMKSGTHAVFVYNNTDSKITVQGCYVY